MKVLTIGTDVTIFKKDSAARFRIESYGRLFDELHVIIYSPRGFEVEILSSGVHLYPTNSRWFLFRPFDAVKIGKRIIGQHQINVISVQDPAESGLAGWLLKRTTGISLHIQIHADIFNRHFRENSWKEYVRFFVARFIVPRGDMFRVVSERIRQSLLARFRLSMSTIVVLPIFVDREYISRIQPEFDLHAKYPQFDFIILMVSRLVREKNVELALRALGRLLGTFPKTGLVIVGDGPERAKLEKGVLRLDIAGNVSFVGWQNDLVSYYKTADVYLLTSNCEGYGRSVVEAAAAGLPIVMTDVGVAGEIIRDGKTGCVVPVGDRQALVQALCKVRQDYAAMRRMAEEARREVVVLQPRTGEEYLERYRQSHENILRH